MPQFPLRISVKPYGGENPNMLKKYRAKVDLARRIETWINIHDDGTNRKMFTYCNIATAMGCSKKDVYDILMPVCGGSNGITLGRPEDVV